MKDSKEDIEDSEEKRRKKYLLTVAEETSNKFEKWAEDEGYLTSGGNVNRTLAFRQLVKRNC